MNLRQQKRKLTRVFAHEVFQGRSRAGWTQQAVADRVFRLTALVSKDRERRGAAQLFCGDMPDVVFWYYAGRFGEGGDGKCTSTYTLKSGYIPRI